MAKKKSAKKKAFLPGKSKAKAAHSRGMKAGISLRSAKTSARKNRAKFPSFRARERTPALRSAKKETFTLEYPKPEPPFRDRMIAPPEERLDVQPSAPLESKSIARKKELPRAATALVGAALISIVFAGLFIISLGVEAVLSLALSIPLFVGFSILIYNLLEGKQ